jgi:hypothetical protein
MKSQTIGRTTLNNVGSGQLIDDTLSLRRNQSMQRNART